MFIITPSLMWRSVIFGFVFIHLVLSGSLHFLERGLIASLVLLTLSFSLPMVTVKEHQPEGWMLWLDVALSWIMLIAYALALFAVSISQGVWWGYLAAALILVLGLFVTILARKE